MLIIEMARDPGIQRVLWYVYQQIRQFQQLGDAFMVQHTHTAEMDQEYAAFKEAFIETLTPEERLAGLSADVVRRFFPAEELMRGFRLEQWLNALSPDDRKQLFERLRAEGFGPSGDQSGDDPC